MIPLMSVNFGTDAELFLKTLNHNFIPVTGMVGGTKEEPKDLGVGEPGYTVQEDNAALEFNIPPQQKISYIINEINIALQYINKILPKSVYLDFNSASAIFDESYLQIPELNRLGCQEDYNAWTLCANDIPRPEIPGFRSAAAHVHVSWSNPTDEDKIDLVRLADIFVVLPTIPEQRVDETNRRTLYGKAGAFRPKEYGIEHRVLSNSWIRNKANIQYTLNSYITAMLALNSGLLIEEEDESKIQNAINKPDINLATVLSKKYHDKLTLHIGHSFDDVYSYFNK